MFATAIKNKPTIRVPFDQEQRYQVVKGMSICYAKAMKKTRTIVHLEDEDKEAIVAIRT